MTKDVQGNLDAFIRHDTSDRLPQIAVPALVVAGGRDSSSRPELGRAVAELIPNARFEVMEDECHQPSKPATETGRPGRARRVASVEARNRPEVGMSSPGNMGCRGEAGGVVL